MPVSWHIVTDTSNCGYGLERPKQTGKRTMKSNEKPQLILACCEYLGRDCIAPLHVVPERAMICKGYSVMPYETTKSMAATINRLITASSGPALIKAIERIGLYKYNPGYVMIKYFPDEIANDTGALRGLMNEHLRHLDARLTMTNKSFDAIWKTYGKGKRDAEEIAMRYPDGIVCDIHLDEVISLRLTMRIGIKLAYQIRHAQPGTDGMVAAGWTRLGPERYELVVHEGVFWRACYLMSEEDCAPIECVYVSENPGFRLAVETAGPDDPEAPCCRIRCNVDGTWRDAAEGILRSIGRRANEEAAHFSRFTLQEMGIARKPPLFFTKLAQWWPLVEASAAIEKTDVPDIETCRYCGNTYIVYRGSKQRYCTKKCANYASRAHR